MIDTLGRYARSAVRRRISTNVATTQIFVAMSLQIERILRLHSSNKAFTKIK
jgi:hypothetical protein